MGHAPVDHTGAPSAKMARLLPSRTARFMETLRTGQAPTRGHHWECASPAARSAGPQSTRSRSGCRARAPPTRSWAGLVDITTRKPAMGGRGRRPWPAWRSGSGARLRVSYSSDGILMTDEAGHPNQVELGEGVEVSCLPAGARPSAGRWECQLALCPPEMRSDGTPRPHPKRRLPSSCARQGTLHRHSTDLTVAGTGVGSGAAGIRAGSACRPSAASGWEPCVRDMTDGRQQEHKKPGPEAEI